MPDPRLTTPLDKEVLEELSIPQLERLQEKCWEHAEKEGLSKWATLLTLDQPAKGSVDGASLRTYSRGDMEIKYDVYSRPSGTRENVEVFYGPKRVKVFSTRTNTFAPGPWVQELYDKYEQRRWEMDNKEEAEVARRERERRRELVRGLTIE